MACCQDGYRVQFVTAADLVTLPVEAQQQRRLQRRLDQLARYDAARLRAPRGAPGWAASSKGDGDCRELPAQGLLVGRGDHAAANWRPGLGRHLLAVGGHLGHPDADPSRRARRTPRDLGDSHHRLLHLTAVLVSPMKIPRSRSFSAIALIVDLNGFTAMIRRAPGDGMLAAFTRDALVGGIHAVEGAGGEVVAFMGDAFLAVLRDASSAFNACVMIARDLDRQCEWISNVQQEDPVAWSFSPGGPSLKIAFEWGTIHPAEISSRRLGTQVLLVGDPINYASRISAAGAGNRCLCGPRAACLLKELGYGLAGPSRHPGTKSDGPYVYFDLDLGDIWISGHRATVDASATPADTSWEK